MAARNLKVVYFRSSTLRPQPPVAIMADKMSTGQGQFGFGPDQQKRVVSIADYREDPMIAKSKSIQEELRDIALHRRLKEKLRNYRALHGLNQQQMADKLRIPKDNYTKYERDQVTPPFRKIPLDTALEFCELAGIDVQELRRELRKKEIRRQPRRKKPA